MDGRMRQDLDRHITGNWGEDQFRGEDEVHNTYVFTFETSAPIDRENADILLEKLNHLLNDDMHLETVVSYTVNEDENETDNRQQRKNENTSD